jgi:hypothetical protein
LDEPDPSESVSSLFESKEEAPEVELHENKEVAPEPPEPPEPPKDDPTLALQKQLDELRKSEEFQRNRAEQAAKEREEAIKRAQERDVEVVKFQKEATQSQLDHVSTALSAAQAEAESAKRDIKTAITNADPDAQTEAYERLAAARANISKLEDGKFELEARVKAEPRPEVRQEPKQQQPQLPESALSWLHAHPQYLSDPEKNAQIQWLHHVIVKEGKSAFSPEYFNRMEEHLGLREAPKEPEKPQEQQRTNIVSAPVSREVPSGGTGTRRNGQVTLSPAEKEAAKDAGVTETEYAKQKLRLIEEKSKGNYSGGQ